MYKENVANNVPTFFAYTFIIVTLLGIVGILCITQPLEKDNKIKNNRIQIRSVYNTDCSIINEHSFEILVERVKYSFEAYQIKNAIIEFNSNEYSILQSRDFIQIKEKTKKIRENNLSEAIFNRRTLKLCVLMYCGMCK